MKKQLAITLILLGIFQYLQSDNRQENQAINKDSIISEYDFITANEYGKYLYENPRGISCKSCHGEYGQGEVIAKYIKMEKEVELKAPNITSLSKERFELAINTSKSIMPKYYLTTQEISAIYTYIQSYSQIKEIE
ncbi:c-type cytochrome [Helicobacter saguini]|uniref:C-type cytochrome n=1 Tax=Helicobacter saguini TaxID=1548018 RepID=A0A347VRB1_9HELI|nr:c-type cytochrome [Helicobacter saguini]MWV62968.1 c-type cytochrome [Helicobacter saguini]MWV66363.1 c-type cytochrome [Helicobacter saguini]MWV68715.1 c-type cytochrome [Helicobacter saguini]MWV71734.1 c-type cytochrome [Helicobacter saguini]TLD92175.1 c-type cytochrome [Helicobacter saguini]